MERKIQYRAYIMTKKKMILKPKKVSRRSRIALKELDDEVVTSPHYTRLKLQPIDFNEK